MFRELPRKTTSYRVSDYSDYIVDIVELSDEWEAWLYHKNFAVKMFMFGSLKKQELICGRREYDLKAFIELVEANVNDYIDDYNGKRKK